MTLRNYAFSRQHRTQFSEDVYAFVLWRYVAVQILRVKELFVPGIVASLVMMRLAQPTLMDVTRYFWYTIILLDWSNVLTERFSISDQIQTKETRF